MKEVTQFQLFKGKTQTISPIKPSEKEQNQFKLQRPSQITLSSQISASDQKNFSQVIKRLQVGKVLSQKVSFNPALVTKDSSVPKFQSVNIMKNKMGGSEKQQETLPPVLTFKQNASNKIIEKKKKEEEAVQRLADKLSNVLLLKNNIKGNDTRGFRKNKDIQDKWSDVIEDICERREAEKLDKTEKAKLLKEAQAKFALIERIKQASQPFVPQIPVLKKENQNSNTLTVASAIEQVKVFELGDQEKNAQGDDEESAGDKKSQRKNTEYSLFKAIKKHSRAADGSPMTQVVTTLQNAAIRESKLQQNPYLKYLFDQYTGDKYILKLDKRNSKKKKSTFNMVNTLSGEHFLEAQLKRKKKLRKEWLKTVGKAGEMSISSSSDDSQEGKSPVLKYMRQATMKNKNINKLMNYYSQRTLKRDFQKMFNEPVLQNSHTLRSLVTEINEVSDEDDLPTPQNLKKNQSSFPYDEVLFKSLKRERIRATQMIELFQEEFKNSNNMQQYSMPQRKVQSQAKLHHQEAKQLAERLSVPKQDQPITFFGVPPKDKQVKMNSTRNKQSQRIYVGINSNSNIQNHMNKYSSLPNSEYQQKRQSTKGSNDFQRTGSYSALGIQRSRVEFNGVGSNLRIEEQTSENMKGSDGTTGERGPGQQTTESELTKSTLQTQNPTYSINAMIKELRDLQKQESHNKGCNVIFQRLNKDLDAMFNRSSTILKIGVKPRTTAISRRLGLQKSSTQLDLGISESKDKSENPQQQQQSNRKLKIKVHNIDEQITEQVNENET